MYSFVALIISIMYISVILVVLYESANSVDLFIVSFIGFNNGYFS